MVKRKARTSWIGDHGNFIVEVSSDGKLLEEKVIWCCNYCNKTFGTVASTGSATHLNKKHNTVEESDERPAKRPRPSDLELQQAGAMPIREPQ